MRTGRSGSLSAACRACFADLPRQGGYNERLRAALPLARQAVRDLAADSDGWLDTAWIAAWITAWIAAWIADRAPVQCARSRPAVQRSDLAG